MTDFLLHLKKVLSSIEGAIDDPAVSPRDIGLLHHHQEGHGDFKHGLGYAPSIPYSLDAADDGKICRLLAQRRIACLLAHSN